MSEKFKKNLKLSIYILTGIFAVFLLIALIFLSLYLFALPKLVKSDFVINKVNEVLKTSMTAQLQVEDIQLSTYLKPKIDFKVKNLLLKEKNETLVELDDFDFSLSFNKIFKKELRLNKLKADTLIIRADKLLSALNIQEQTEQKPVSLDWKIDFYNADIRLNNFELSYKQKDSIFDLTIKDAFLEYLNEYKNLGFNFEAFVSKNGRTYADIIASSTDEIKIYNDRAEINDLRVLINNSDLKLNSRVDINNIFLNAVSKHFYLEDVFALVNSDFIIPNGEELLKPLISPSGSVSFDVNLNNEDLSGYVVVNNTKASIKDVTSIPLNIQNGKILISKDKIDFPELLGYWGKNKNNRVKIYGDIKDYYKTFDSNITIDTVITNEFFKDYLAPLIANTVLHVSKPSGTRIVYKAKNNIMDITWLAKINKGVNFGVDDSKSALSDYDRAVRGDFHIEGNSLDIKNINYYIASDIKKGVKIEPIIVFDAKMDLMGKIDNFGVKFARKMPCELLNVIAGSGLFKKGTMEGGAHLVFKNNIPYLDADMKIENTFIPSQRLKISSANLKTSQGLINVNLKGRFKRAEYDFSGKIKNELKPPFIIENMKLNLDNVDVERFLTAVNNQTQVKPVNNQTQDDEIADDDFMFDTSFIRIKDCDFYLEKGKYKELNFGNIKANLTLNEKGILNIQSNKFDIAQGISTLKVNCDLNKLKYYIRLGVKDVDSNLMAKVLFNLDKEITGKASGLIELNSDKTLRMNGDIKFLVNDGTIGKIGLVEYVLKIASVFRNPIVMISPATIMDIVSIPEGKFDKITGEIKLKDNVVQSINIKSYSKTLSALIRGRFDLEEHDASLRIYTRFSTDKNSMFGFLRNMSLNALANKVPMNTRNDANYYESELVDLPQIDLPEERTQVFLTAVEGDVEHNNFLSSLKKIK